MGTKPVHAVLGLVLLSGALASGCRSNGGGGGGTPGVIGSNTPSNTQSNTPSSGAFGRDPYGMGNAPSSRSAVAGGVSPSTVYNENPGAPTIASSAASPGGVREYPSGVNMDNNGTVSNARPMGWTGSPRSNTAIPGGTFTAGGAPGNPNVANPTGTGTAPSGGVMPVSYQPQAPRNAVTTNLPNPSPDNFPSGGRDGFKEQPAMAGSTMQQPAGSTMTFTGGTSGDVGRTPPPTVDTAGFQLGTERQRCASPIATTQTRNENGGHVPPVAFCGGKFATCQ